MNPSPPELAASQQAPAETLFQYVCRFARLLKAREDEIGHAGDGPTAVQVDALVSSLRPFTEDETEVTPALGFIAFKCAIDTEMSWLFPDDDPLGAPMVIALQKVRETTGNYLKGSMPEQADQLQQYVNLAIIQNAARRQVKLHGNGINWRLAFARFLHWIGGGKRP